MQSANQGDEDEPKLCACPLPFVHHNKNYKFVRKKHWVDESVWKKVHPSKLIYQIYFDRIIDDEPNSVLKKWASSPILWLFFYRLNNYLVLTLLVKSRVAVAEVRLL